MNPRHNFWMTRALSEAARGRGAVEPNPMVGAVIVDDERLLAVGHHAQFGGPHAEVVALETIENTAAGATLYVTLEPCSHFGKTPPCTDAIIRAGIRRVVASMSDPFPKVAGNGFAKLREAGINVLIGVLEEESKRLNAPYLKRLSQGRPFVTAKWAMTLDGKIATASGHSQWISGPRSRAIVHELRGRMDAIIIGIGTALADDPRLTARPAGPRLASRVVLDSNARLPLNSQLVQTSKEVPTLISVTNRAPIERVVALEAAGCEVIRMKGCGQVSISLLLDELGQRGMTNVLVEGGGRTIGAFFDEGEIDALEVFIAPMLEGGPPSFTPTTGRGAASMDLVKRLERHEIAVLDGDVHLRGEFPHSWLDGD